MYACKLLQNRRYIPKEEFSPKYKKNTHIISNNHANTQTNVYKSLRNIVAGDI